MDRSTYAGIVKGFNKTVQALDKLEVRKEEERVRLTDRMLKFSAGANAANTEAVKAKKTAAKLRDLLGLDDDTEGKRKGH